MHQILTIKSNIKKSLDILSVRHRTVFGAACCERIAPNYMAFSLAHQWGNFRIVEQCLEAIWTSLQGEGADQHKLETLLNSIEEVAPDPGKHDSVYVAQAIFVVDAVSSLIQHHLTGETKHILNIVDISVITIELYLRDVCLPHALIISPEQARVFDEWIWQSPLLQAELSSQTADLALLKRQKILTRQFLEPLRNDCQSTGMQLLKRGLIVVGTAGE